MANNNRHNLLWVDLEMSGLGDEHVILEIAAVITNERLEIKYQFPDKTDEGLAINRNDRQLKNIEKWSYNQHTKSGLMERVKNSLIGIAEAEKQIFRFVTDKIESHKAILCGNSIWVDRKFLKKEMSLLEQYLHYRMIDVSSIKELVKRWYPQTKFPEKNKTHLAMDDIKESIKELKWYRQEFFTNPDYIGKG